MSLLSVCFKLILFSVLMIRNARAVEIESEYAVLIDYDTTEVLYKKNMDEISAPSSMTKIMTAYVVFDMLESKNFDINDKFKVSVRAWRQDGTRMFLEPEWKIAIDELLKGLLVASGNDAAVTLAEGSSGSIGGFVEKMNATTKKIGMTNSHFNNPTGLYEKTHYASVHDMALLSRALIKNHKKYYDKYFSIDSINFNNVNQKNRNWLLSEYKGTDGLKTGYTEQGKYSIAVSAERDGKRLIVVLNGAKNDRTRIDDAKKLFDYGFSQYKCLKLFNKNDVVGEAGVFFSKGDKAVFYTKEDIIYATKKSKINELKVQLIYNKYILAPIRRDDKIGKLRILDGDEVFEYDLYSKNDIQNTTRFQKIKTLFAYNFKKLILFWKS